VCQGREKRGIAEMCWTVALLHAYWMNYWVPLKSYKQGYPNLSFKTEMFSAASGATSERCS